jgi:hypothetical protein
VGSEPTHRPCPAPHDFNESRFIFYQTVRGRAGYGIGFFKTPGTCLAPHHNKNQKNPTPCAASLLSLSLSLELSPLRCFSSFFLNFSKTLFFPSLIFLILLLPISLPSPLLYFFFFFFFWFSGSSRVCGIATMSKFLFSSFSPCSSSCASSSSFFPGPFLPRVTDHRKDYKPYYKNKAKQGLSYAVRNLGVGLMVIKVSVFFKKNCLFLFGLVWFSVWLLRKSLICFIVCYFSMLCLVPGKIWHWFLILVFLDLGFLWNPPRPVLHNLHPPLRITLHRTDSSFFMQFVGVIFTLAGVQDGDKKDENLSRLT